MLLLDHEQLDFVRIPIILASIIVLSLIPAAFAYDGEITLSTEKQDYYFGDVFWITGSIEDWSGYEDTKRLKLSLIDSDTDKIWSGEPSIETNGSFKHVIDLRGSFEKWELNETYTVEAEYDGTKATTQFNILSKPELAAAQVQLEPQLTKPWDGEVLTDAQNQGSFTFGETAAVKVFLAGDTFPEDRTVQVTLKHPDTGKVMDQQKGKLNDLGIFWYYVDTSKHDWEFYRDYVVETQVENKRDTTGFFVRPPPEMQALESINDKGNPMDAAKEEMNSLKEENQQLKNRITSLELELQKMSNIIREQVKVLTDLGNQFNELMKRLAP